MSVKNPTNMPASVRMRLFNQSKKEQRPFIEILQYYAMERFLYRLSMSAHSTRFILKGALMLRVWESPMARPTMDIDMLGISNNKEEHIIAQIRDILSVKVVSDGIVFEPESIKTSKILEDADYEGLHVMFLGKLDTAKIKIRIDIGFGDIVFPHPEKAFFPTLLNFPAPNLLCYSKESAIAEKFDAMVSRGLTNSRMKDFYDIWLLARQFDFELQTLAEAIRLTFSQRKTEFSKDILAFSKEYIEAKQAQWAIFRNKLEQKYVPELFQVIIRLLETFLRPAVSRIFEEEITIKKWNAPGPWV